MPNLNDPVPVSSIPSLNAGLTSAGLQTMIKVLGAPREPLDQKHCRNDQASPAVKRLLETRQLTQNISIRGIKPALDSVQEVLTKVKAANPDLIDKLQADMICVRHRKPTNDAFSDKASNHSWGTALDFNLIGQAPPADTGSTVPRWVAILVPFFNQAGWFSGVGFTNRDAMHFEVADETIRKWSRDGLLGMPGMHDDEEVVVAGNNGSGTSPSQGSVFTPITHFFSNLFGRS